MSAVSLKIEIDRAGFDALVARGVNVQPLLERGGKQAVIMIGDAIAAEVRAGGSLDRRSGALARSWQGEAKVEVTATGATLDASIASNLPYAGIQETGGTVTPKNGQYLAIPLDPAKTAAGVSRYSSPLDVPDLFPIRSRAGNLLLVKRVGDMIEPWFLLRESVDIPASHYASNGVRKAAPKVEANFARLTAAHLAGA